MKIAKVVGNVVSTIKDKGFEGQKLMIVDYLDEDGNLTGNNAIVFDVAHAGIGDTVVIAADGGAVGMLLGKKFIGDQVICGVIDHINYEGETREYH